MSLLPFRLRKILCENLNNFLFFFVTYKKFFDLLFFAVEIYSNFVIFQNTKVVHCFPLVR